MTPLRVFLETMLARSDVRFFLPIVLFLSVSCETSDICFDNPERFLETRDFPEYFLKIPYYGVNGRNGLDGFEQNSVVDIRGIYVKGKGISFLRIFSDSGLFYVLLEDDLPFDSETDLLNIRGIVLENNEPYIKAVEVKSGRDVGKIRETVEGAYPELVSRIKKQIHNPNSKLDLSNIKEWHLAAREDKILVFGRTYDLMYEFDIGILVEKQDNSCDLQKIYAREFFKGE